MCGADTRQEGLFSYVLPESRIPDHHPLREIRRLTDEALAALSADFKVAYSPLGRPSIAPEKLIRALLLQVFYTVRSVQLLMEQLDYNLLFRRFVGLSVDEPVWVPTVFTHNRERLLEAEIVHRFFAEVVARAKASGLSSGEHFSVEGTLIEAWATMKSFRPKDEPPPNGGNRRNAAVDFRGETRSNDSRESTTNPDCRLYKKAHGQAAKLCHPGHLLMENRNGFISGHHGHASSGNTERDAAVHLAGGRPGEQRKTLGVDKGYDTADCVQALRKISITPHLAQNNTNRKSALNARTTRHPRLCREPVHTQAHRNPFRPVPPNQTGRPRIRSLTTMRQV